MFRPSCENCYYTNLRRPSDITIADFWGWDKTDAKINSDNKGVSLVLCSTKKGNDIFDRILNIINYIPADIENCLQPNLQSPTKMYGKNVLFESDYKKYGFDYIAHRYGNIGWRYYAKRFIQKVKTAIRLMLRK